MENIAETTEKEQELADIFDGWEDAPEIEESPKEVSNDVVDDDNTDSESDQTNEEAATESSETTEETPSAEEAEQTSNQKYTLKHLDETKDVTLDEMKEMAQKGWDYDRIRTERDGFKEMAKNSKNYKKYADFLEELKGDFDSVEDLMDDTRARLLSKKDNISHEDALKRVRDDRIAKEQSEAVVQPDVMTQEEKQSSIREFVQAYHDVDPKTIPQSVWNEFSKTHNLKSSYENWKNTQRASEMETELKKLREENEMLKHNEKNKERSTGSQHSSGTKTSSAIYAGWED